MKDFGEFCVIVIIFLIASFAILSVDRQCAMIYGREGAISTWVEVFAENKLNLR